MNCCRAFLAPGIILNFQSSWQHSSPMSLLIFSSSLHITLPSEANCASQAHGSREDRYWLYACLFLPGSRFYYTAFTTEPYHILLSNCSRKSTSFWKNTAMSWKGSLWSGAGLCLSTGQRDAGLWWASIGHVCRSRETQIVRRKKHTVMQKENLGVICRRGNGH